MISNYKLNMYSFVVTVTVSDSIEFQILYRFFWRKCRLNNFTSAAIIFMVAQEDGIRCLLAEKLLRFTRFK